MIWREDGETRVQEGKDDLNGEGEGRDFSKLYWRLRGPNQWPPEDLIPGFREAYTKLASSTLLTCSSRPIAHIGR